MTTPLTSPNVPIHKSQRFEQFFRLFEDAPGVFKYQDQINDIFSKGGNTLVIFYEDLLAFDSQIAEMLREDPESILEDAVDAFKNVLKFQGAKITDEYYFVRITTKDEKSPLNIPLRGLRAKNIDNLVCSNGILVRSSAIRPKLVKATFECMICGAQFEIIQLTAKIKWPKFCTNKRCKARSQSDFRLISKISEFIDWQSIVIQEIPEDLPPGRIPRSVQAILTYDLVDMVKPGDRVKILGILKSVLAQSTKSMNSTLFKTYIDVNFIDPEDKSDELIDLSKEDKLEIEKLSKEPMIQKKIARSISPTIYGREDLKMACALTLFAGTRKKKLGGGYKRGDIHVLFVGDPGTGKSVHGSERIYVGENKNEFIDWKVQKIGDLIDDLIDLNKNRVISDLETEVLYLTNKNLYTYSINPITLKTQKTRIKEVSRHKAKILVRIETNCGRTVLATPNHSFSTLNNGKLETIDISQLNNENYLPIARNLNFPDTHQNISLNDFFDEQELVYLKKIKDNISSFKSKKKTLKTAALASNITQGTVLSYIRNSYIILDQDLIRRKYDTTWIPKNIKLDDRFGRIVGFFLAEGDVIKNSIRITNYNSELLNLIEQDFFEIFQRVSRYDDHRNIQFHNSSLSMMFKYFFGTGAENKKIPDKFLYTPYQFRRNLLSAYFTGDGYIEQKGLYLSALTKSKSLAYSITDLLSTVDIFAKIGKKVVRNGKYKGNLYYKIILTGQEVIRFCEKIGFLSSEKQKKLEEVVKIKSLKSRNQAKDIIPNFGDLLKRISKDVELKGKRNTWQRKLLGELRGKTQRQRAGRIYLKKIVSLMEDLYKRQEKKIGNDLIWLKQLTESDIFWDKIKTIDIINKETYVYDIGTDDGHFILAKGNLIVHNSEILKSAIEVSPRGLYTSGKGSTAVGLTAAVIKDNETGQMNLEAGAVVLANGGVAAIDEFDKMDPADRSALHEAMEQQSYHYKTEILSSNGKRFLIGEFIDNLFQSNSEDIIQGIDCEILPFRDLELYSTDFNQIFKIKTDRLSRHKAPDLFYKITFNNGRSITVTPEHPLFVFREGNIANVEASKCNINDFIPLPNYLPNSTIPIELGNISTIPHPNAKFINFPLVLNSKLSRVLGYLVSEGHSFKGSGAEIGFSNKDEALLEDMQSLMYDTFGLEPSISTREDGLITLRYISIELFKWMILNFQEVMVKSIFKRIPIKILSGSREIAKSFLKSAFRGDGSVESTAICYRTSSKGLSHDYQDLLLKLGIQSRILLDTHNNSYKVYICGHSLIKFYHEIVEREDKRFNRIANLIKPHEEKAHHHDIFPTSLINNILSLKSNLAIADDGYYYKHLKNRHGITRNIIIKEFNLIKDKYQTILRIMRNFYDLKRFRHETGYSQYDISKICGCTRGNIDYLERNGYNKEKRHEFQKNLLNALKNHLDQLKMCINNLESFISSDISWGRIKKIKTIPNKGKSYTPWVYDITVEPNHTFISQGVILHNTVSIAKAGIVATLKAQTAIIAAANPRSGRYDRYKTPTQNIHLPPSLLSRFDLIFVVVDKPNPADDAQMAEFILRSAMTTPDAINNEKDGYVAPIPGDLLKKYIKHARKTCHPSLTDESKEKIKEFYLELRNQYDTEDAIVSILARNLDALVRLSEAHAKMALREKVLKEDVEEIIKIFKRYLKDTGYDETTGKIDMDRILVGQSRSSINKLDKLLTRLKEIFEENKWKALEKSNVIPILALEEDLDEKWVKDALDELVREGTLYEPRTNTIKFTNKDE